MYISLSLIASVIAGVQLVSGTPTNIDTRADNGACAKAASAAVAAAKATPGVNPSISAELAYNCLKTVPFKKDPAVNLVKSLKAYAQLESNIDYLRNPPSGYLYDAVDVPKLLEAIQTKITSKDPYDNEYDFLIDLQSALMKAKDGHFAFIGYLTSQFKWLRNADFSLVSVSLDGKALPQVYRAQDILKIDPSGIDLLNNTKASPIKTINGMDVQQFLLAEANQNTFQDPDAAVNSHIFSVQTYGTLGRTGKWNNPLLYPGSTTTIEYQNGSKTTFNNEAQVNATALSGVLTGEDMYKRFCSSDVSSFAKRDLEHEDNLTPLFQRDEGQLISRQASAFNIYPKPDYKDLGGVLSGYLYPKADLAVLAVYSFLPGKGSSDAILSFQSTAQKFFAACTKANISNLIIDLQGNGGGSLDLSIDLIAQLFPDKAPNSKDNMRASLGMHGIMLAASNVAQSADKEDAATNAEIDDTVVPFAYQEVMTPDVKNFNRLADFYGPAHIGNGFFTNFFQGNYTNDRPSQFGLGGIIITGTNSRKGFKQPFKPENMIMLTDGHCASACTIFQEHMKMYGVQIITLGGRAQTGPMQAVGGTKGSQVFQAGNIGLMVRLFNTKEANTELSKAKGTVWEDFNNLPIARSNTAIGINGRNQFRIGDSTQTPLQFVYEAADCRIWVTPAMAADPEEIWETVAVIAFVNRKNGVITSELCVKDSLKHATSLSGGLKTGDIGPQTPPTNAKPKVSGMLFNGKDISNGLASGKINDNSPVDASTNTGEENQAQALSPEVIAATGVMANVCKGYTGQEWFVQLMCRALMKQGGS